MTCVGGDLDHDHFGSPGDARVPRLAALLASLRCLSRRGSPSAPAPFSPTHCRSLCDRRPQPLPQRNHARVPHARTGYDPYRTAHRRFLVPRGRSLRSLSQGQRARVPRARDWTAAHPGRRRAAGREPGSASPTGFQRRGRRWVQGFASLRRSGHPTQSSSLLLGARPDPHPVVGVRIGPSPLRSRSAPRAHSTVRVPLRRSRTCAPP